MKKTNLIILASNSKGKIPEFKRMLKKFKDTINVVAMGEIGFTRDVAETADTFKGNAALKLNAIENYILNSREYILNDYNKVVILADDSGINFDALPGEYGVKTKRQIESGGNDWSILIDEVAGKDRTARFTSTLAYKVLKGADTEDVELIAKELVGIVSESVRGDNGFGFDTIFEVDGKTLAELSNEEKDDISPRGDALKELVGKVLV